jgi:hypothetical protein
MARMDDRRLIGRSGLARHAQRIVDECSLTAHGPADDPATEGIEDHAAGDLALTRRVLGDVVPSDRQISRLLLMGRVADI